MTASHADQRLMTHIELNLIRFLIRHNAINHDIDALRAIHIRLVNTPIEALTGKVLELHDTVISQLTAMMSDLTGHPATTYYRPLLAVPDDASGLDDPDAA